MLFKTNTHFPVPSFLDFNTLPDILGALPDIWLKGEEIHRRCACKLYYFTRCSFGGVIAGEPDVMGTCFIHKGKWKHSVNLPFTKILMIIC